MTSCVLLHFASSAATRRCLTVFAVAGTVVFDTVPTQVAEEFVSVRNAVLPFEFTASAIVAIAAFVIK